MELIDHQMMGYDRAITLFSPDGRLLQVEYAKKTVRQGSTAIGIVYKEGVILVTDKRVLNTLLVADAVEKIFVVDEHIIATAAGIISDARVLISRGQVYAQQHRLNYDNPIDVFLIVKDLCDLKQYFTQSGGARPFGVSLLIAGYDAEPRLYETDPTGIYFRYLARAIGEHEEEAEKILQKEYKQGMGFEEAVKFSLSIMKKLLKEEFSLNRIDLAYVDSSKTNKKLTKKEIESFMKK
ncbi:MAG TPA: archaeal proteasome endopeptidase complex subunit alpha [Candidatus Woesearchaeota archaeon]|nr:archaeal proteasome endopeptidase complex subunit alpha [Candidatus Woesearchaeota archaeon]